MSGKQQPTEGCCLQLLSKRLLRLILSVPSSLVLSVGTESTMKERHEAEYKSKEARLKTTFKYKGRPRLYGYTIYYAVFQSPSASLVPLFKAGQFVFSKGKHTGLLPTLTNKIQHIHYDAQYIFAKKRH